MPSIRVYVLPGVARRLIYPLDSKLFHALRSKVAEAFGLEEKDTEVLMIPIESSANAAPLAVEVVYSVTSRLNLDETARVALADEIVAMLSGFSWLPAEVYEVSAWIRPQHDAIFRIAPRKTL